MYKLDLEKAEEPEIKLRTSDGSYCSYCSWDSQGKNTEVVCHSLLQWTTFCQNSPHDLSVLGGPTWHGLVSVS